jgi:hypothetical protein
MIPQNKYFEIETLTPGKTVLVSVNNLVSAMSLDYNSGSELCFNELGSIYVNTSYSVIRKFLSDDCNCFIKVTQIESPEGLG